MTLHKLVYLPDPRLRQPTETITEFDDKLLTLINDMYETMYRANGIGLAAPQIGLPLKLAVIDVSEKRNDKFCIINPENHQKRNGELMMEEGCLSVPGVFDKAPRATNVTVRAQNEKGEFREISGDGLLAHCLQHEVDHLNGKTICGLFVTIKAANGPEKN